MNLLVLSNNTKRASFRQQIAVYIDALRAKGVSCEVAKLPSGPLARRQLFKRTAEFDGVSLHRKGLNFLDAFYLGALCKSFCY